MTAPKTLREASCADDYDPNSMPVERARALIRDYLEPVTAVERVHIRQALGRTLAADVVSPIDVPGHDNSAMDGWAVRFADLAPGAYDARLLVWDAREQRNLGATDATGRHLGASVSLGQVDVPPLVKAK